MSYVSQQFLLYDVSSAANFKNWGQAISSAFSSAGWTQTSDTGQVVWASVSAPSANTTVYEIWQPSDALQTGSTKFYLKIEYGRGSSTGPTIFVTISTSTDGAGAMNGFSSTRFQITNTNAANQGSVLTYDCYFSGDTDRFGMMMWRGLTGTGGAPAFMVVERTHNTDGTNSSDGATIVAFSATGSNTGGQSTIVFGVGAKSAAANTLLALYNGTNASAIFNNNIPVSPVFPEYGKYGNPLTGAALVHTQDVAEGCIFTATLYGATRTYLATSNTVESPGNTKICLRYD